MQILEKSVEQLSDILNKTILKSIMLGRNNTQIEIIEHIMSEEVRKVAEVEEVHVVRGTNICVSDNDDSVREIEHEIAKYCRIHDCNSYKTATLLAICGEHSKIKELGKECLNILGIQRYSELEVDLMYELKPEINNTVTADAFHTAIMSMSEVLIVVQAVIDKTNTKIRFTIEGKHKDFEDSNVEDCIKCFKEQYYNRIESRLLLVRSESCASDIPVGKIYISCSLRKK